MFLENINISRLMAHGQQVKGDNIRELAKENKKFRTWNYEYSLLNWVVKIAHRVSRSFQQQPLHQLVFHPPRIGMIRNIGYQVLSLRGVFQAPKYTKTTPSVVKNMRASA